MKYLIDTEWVVDLLKGKPETIAKLIAFSPDGIAISLITYGEVYDGIIYGRQREQHEKGFLEFLNGVDVLTLNAAIMYEFALLRGNLRAQGQLIGDFDILIAATALHHRLTLLTNNRSHFQRIPGLVLLS